MAISVHHHLHNYAGQVRINYTGFQFVGPWTAGVEYLLDPEGASSVTLSSAPTTTWPHRALAGYEYVYDTVTNRWRENPIQGQVHRWRVIGEYSGKSINNNGQLSISMRNPDSGFAVNSDTTLPSGMIAGSFTGELITIADPASLASGRGYVLEAETSFDDATLTLQINSVTRFSLAVDWPLFD